jgi:DNA-binding response OmpR family regulator
MMLIEPETRRALRQQGAAMPGPRNLRILVARDADHPGPALEPALWAAGYAVEVAVGEPDARVMARLSPPDVVLLEVSAFTDGWRAAATAIRDAAAWRKPMVVALPLRGTADGLARSRDAGVHLYAEGPVEFEKLDGFLRRFAALLAGVEGFDPAI